MRSNANWPRKNRASPAAADSALQASNASVPEIDQRIDAQKRQLDDLLRRFTEDHPDVVSARRTIAQLERQKQRRTRCTRARRQVRQPRGPGQRPVLQKIRISLADAEANVAALRARVWRSPGAAWAIARNGRQGAAGRSRTCPTQPRLRSHPQELRRPGGRAANRPRSAVAVDATSQLRRIPGGRTAARRAVAGLPQSQGAGSRLVVRVAVGRGRCGPWWSRRRIRPSIVCAACVN